MWLAHFNHASVMRWGFSGCLFGVCQAQLGGFWYLDSRGWIEGWMEPETARLCNNVSACKNPDAVLGQ